jgi:hypothetical protein
MNLNLRIVLAGILSVTLGLLGTISISVQGQQPATVQPIPNEPMFSTIYACGGKIFSIDRRCRLAEGTRREE